jgi:hypothetical protein
MAVMHEQDSDCAPFLVDEQCTVCGVTHSNECPECHGRGFHKPKCPDNENNWQPRQGKPMKFKTGTVKARNVDLDEIDFAVDTALSWEGTFPEAGKGDYLVTIGYVDGEPANILVSRRYTSAVDADNAAEIALDAFAERHGYDSDDEGHILEVTLEGLGTGVPCWVERVDRMTK